MSHNRINPRVISFLAMCALFMALLAQTGWSQSAGSYQATPEPLPTTFAGQPVYVQQLKMLNEQDGWAVASLSDDLFYSYILRTEDGGATWQDVTPYRVFGTKGVSAFFLDHNDAWLLSGDTGDIWITQDGGQSWISIPFPGRTTESAILSFPDAVHGWILIRECCAAGNEFGSLYQTADGGYSWTLIADSDFAGAQFATLTNSYHTGMAFANEQEGWMTTSSISGEGGIVHTLDGGESWQVVKTISRCDVMDLTVFSPQSLTVVALCHIWDDEIRQMVDVYSTADAGQHWTVRNINAAFIDEEVNITGPTTFSLPFSMINPDVSWILVRPPEFPTQQPRALYQTQDGAQTWIKRSELPAELPEYPTFYFIDEHTGWAFDQMGVFLRTDDAGQTWTALSPRLR